MELIGYSGKNHYLCATIAGYFMSGGEISALNAFVIRLFSRKIPWWRMFLLPQSGPMKI